MSTQCCMIPEVFRKASAMASFYLTSTLVFDLAIVQLLVSELTLVSVQHLKQ